MEGLRLSGEDSAVTLEALQGSPHYLAEKNTNDGFPALFSKSRGFSQICLSLYFIYNVCIWELWEYDLPK